METTRWSKHSTREQKLPAGAGGGKRPAGIATEYIIYLAGLADFFLLLIQNLFLAQVLMKRRTGYFYEKL